MFEYIDSVEQLEILLLLAADRQKQWTAEGLAQHLRSNRNSVEQRLSLLLARGLVSSTGNVYQFSPQSDTVVATVNAVAGAYKTHRHRVMELIFSPMKKARDFSDAFRVTSYTKKKGDENG